MKPKLSRSSRWLLSYLARIHPLGQAATVGLPCHWTEQPKMAQVNGLVRRGWVEERCRGIYYITEEGIRQNGIIPAYPDHPAKNKF